MTPSRTRLDVALVQTDVALVDVDKNLSIVGDHVARYAAEVDWLVFPELTLSGYAVDSRYPEAALRLDDARFTKLVDATRGVGVAVGLVEETPELRFYNSLALLEDGAVRAVHRKIALPTYGMFEEGKFFSRGASHRCVDVAGFRVAPFVCADAWSPGLVHLAALDDANVLMFSVCSPDAGIGAKLSSQAAWKRLCRFYATVYGAYVVFVNRVGREGALQFWGQSEVVDPFGEVVASIPDDREAVVTATLDLARVREARVMMPGTRDEDLSLLQRGLARVARKRQDEGGS